MEVILSHRILKIKSHWILTTEYLCIEVTDLDFLTLNESHCIFSSEYVCINVGLSDIFILEFNKMFKVKKKQVLIQIHINLNLNIFNVPKFNMPNSASKWNVRNSALTSGNQGRTIDPRC